MPIIKGAKKALRSSIRKRGFNLQRKKSMKEAIKEIDNLLTDKKVKEASVLVPKVYQAIDKATKRGLIKKNTAARKKSRLLARLNKLSSSK